MRSSARSAGASPGGDFWAWRDGMIALAESLTVDEIRREYVEVYRELRANGYTAVGEFHYLGLEEARAAAAAADEAGIALVLLSPATSAAASRDSGRSRSPTTCASSRRCARTASGSGVAPHSVRACPADALRELGRYAARARAAAARARRRAAARDRGMPRRAFGLRPIELLAREGCLGPRTTVVHATHADGHELDLLRDAGAAHLRLPDDRGQPRRRVPARCARIRHRGIAMCIGSDSNVRIDPLEELRELEGIARRQTGKRGVCHCDALLAFGSDEGAAALGLEPGRTQSSTSTTRNSAGSPRLGSTTR